MATNNDTHVIMEPSCSKTEFNFYIFRAFNLEVSIFQPRPQREEFQEGNVPSALVTYKKGNCHYLTIPFCFT